jgi:hydroxymethylglutaryl-CoA lyase
MLAGMEVGVTIFDTAFGGLGGCPFIKGATGNIATEDAANMLHQMGIQTGIDLAKIAALSHEMEAFLERKLPGKFKDVLGTITTI